MGNEQLSKHQQGVYTFLKQQVDNLADESRKNDARPRIEQELLAARIELDDFVEELKKSGVKIQHGRRSWVY